MAITGVPPHLSQHYRMYPISFLKTAAGALLTMTALAAAIPARAHQPEGTWQLHPAYDRGLERIIDTPGRTYLHVPQSTYTAGRPVTSTNRSTIFFIDKNDPDGRPRALAALWPELAAPVCHTSYNPSGAYLAIACEDGMIWILPDGGTPYPIHALAQIIIPGKNRINSISFSPSDPLIRIATTYGYAVADPATKSVTEIRETEVSSEWVFSCGGRTILITDGKLMEAVPSGSRHADVSPLPCRLPVAPEWIMKEGVPSGVSCPMPLTDNSFAFLAPRKIGMYGNALFTATLRDGKWEISQILDDSLRGATPPSAKSVGVAAYENGIPNRDGYYLVSESYAYQLLKGIDPDPAADPLRTNDTSLIRGIYKGDDRRKPSGTWDFSRFTFYNEPAGFYTRILDGTELGEPSPFRRADAPLHPLSTSMTIHPAYGLLVVNPGASYINQATCTFTPMLISSFRNGRWNDLSPVYHTTDPGVTADFTSTAATSFPLSDPDGPAIDPADPDHAYFGSYLQGWARISLADPSETPLHAGNPHDYGHTLKGFVETFPTISIWNQLCAVSSPAFDSEGRLWLSCYNPDVTVGKDVPAILLWYDRTELADMRDANIDPGRFIQAHSLTVPLHTSAASHLSMLPLTHPDNRNLIAINAGGYDNALHILDHGGTPDDPSDDRIILLSGLHDPTGASVTYHHITGFWEEPSDGTLWVSSDHGTFAVKPSASFSNQHLAMRPGSMTADSEGTLRELHSVQSNAFCLDPAGRLWIGTDRGGVYILDQSRSKLAGHISRETSPIQSDRIQGLCWNPERSSMMISTDLGLAEFFPADLTYVPGTASPAPTVTPAVILPSDPGAFNVSGLIGGEDYDVTDESGKSISRIQADATGRLQWEARDSSGRRVAGGVYTLKRVRTGEATASLRIL